MVLEIPEEILHDPNYTVRDLKLDVSILLYKQRKVTLARAANWLGMTRLAFQKELANRQIPINFTVEDFEADLESLKSMPN